MLSANRGLRGLFEDVTLLNTDSNLINTKRLSDKKGSRSWNKC
jgi:hypothetical protein